MPARARSAHELSQPVPSGSRVDLFSVIQAQADPYLESVLGIRDIFVRIQIRIELRIRMQNFFFIFFIFYSYNLLTGTVSSVLKI